ncbi:adaptive-response sensory-kinase SasA [Deinococcus depolymerans]|uniref:PAS domain S-box protein n=1 Tax=Deinococcus depolymerans TaxID=392408 RepID=UPI0030A8DF4E
MPGPLNRSAGRHWATPLSLLMLGAVVVLTGLSFTFTFVRLNRVADLSGASITGWSFSEFVRQAAEVQVLVGRGATPGQLEVPLAILQSKGQVVADEHLVDQLPAESRAALLRAVQEVQAVTPSQLAGPAGLARMETVMDVALRTYTAALQALDRQRSGIATNLRSAERALAGLGLLLAGVSATTVWLLLRNAARALAAEMERTREAEAARGELERGASALRAAQAAAQRDRDFALQLTETMGEGLIMTDAAGAFTYVNPAFAALVDRPAADLLGEAVGEAVPDLRPWPAGAASGTGRFTAEVSLRRADGQDRQVLVTAVPRAPGGVIAVLTDLTDLKRTQARLRALYDVAASPDTGELNAAHLERTLARLLQVGRDAFGGVGAYAVSEGTAWRLSHLTPPSVPDAVLSDLRRGAAQDAPHGGRLLEGRLITVPVTVGGATRGVLVFRRDPTEPAFTPADEDYLKLIGQWAGTQVERQQADALLRGSEARLKAIIASSLDAIITSDEQGVITEFNPAAEQIFAVTRAGALGQRMGELIVPPTLRDAHERGMARVQRGGPDRILGQRLELLARRSDGQDFPVELSVVRLPTDPPVFAGFLRDITERRAAEAQLRERTVQLDSVFKVSPDGFVTFGPDGRITEVNPAFQTLTGLDSAELTGLDEAELEALLLTRSEAVPLTGLGGDALQVAWPARRVLKRTTRVMEGGTGPLGRVMYFRDITPEAEVSLMKSEFLSTAAHELRTPMTSIYGFTELLLTRPLDEETTRDLLDTIYRQAGRLIVLLGELLDLARIEARDRQDFEFREQPLTPLVLGVVRAFTPPGETPRLHLNVPDGLSVRVDAAKFQQALGNVLSNAFKYSPQGGDVQLSVTGVPGGAVHVCVTDQGIGMTEDQRRRAFERFYRADTSGRIPGTGLGLSLVQEIMRCHGGEATLRSVPGQGTSITLSFPPAAPVGGAPTSTAQAGLP